MTKTHKRVLIIVALIIMFSFLTLSLSGCGNNDNQSDTTYTITFHSQGGSAVDPVEVEQGEQIGDLLPEGPTLEGFEFIEWNAQADGEGLKFDKNSVPNSDTIVYAKYRELTDLQKVVKSEPFIVAIIVLAILGLILLFAESGWFILSWLIGILMLLMHLFI